MQPSQQLSQGSIFAMIADILKVFQTQIQIQNQILKYISDSDSDFNLDPHSIIGMSYILHDPQMIRKIWITDWPKRLIKLNTNY